MNPFASPESKPDPRSKPRIKNFWAINRADVAIVGGLVALMLVLLLL